jgi:hypothetical protein
MNSSVAHVKPYKRRKKDKYNESLTESSILAADAVTHEVVATKRGQKMKKTRLDASKKDSTTVPELGMAMDDIDPYTYSNADVDHNLSQQMRKAGKVLS